MNMNLSEMLSWLRSKDWLVAVHNDYRIGEKLFTFWLFTHPSGTYLKAEGPIDQLCLEAICDQVRTIQEFRDMVKK